MLKCADGTLYTGATTDIEKRVYAHNYLKSGAKYTKPRRPVKLAYSESFSSLRDAQKREAVIKKLSRSEKMKLVRSVSRRSSR